MATNIISTEGAWDYKYTATGAVVAGNIVGSGNIYGVALESATGAGVVIAVKCNCEATLSKKATTGAITVGAPLKALTTGTTIKAAYSAATGDTIIGYATAAAATGATTVKARLIYPSVLKGALFV